MNELRDKLALHELVCRYAQAVDRRDWPRFADLFEAGASLSGPGFTLDGREAIVAGMAVLERYTGTQHLVHNHVAEIDGATATAETYGVAHHLYERDGEKRRLDWGLRYQDRFACVAGTWRFTRRTLLLDWTNDAALQEG
jgi:hypothetical protein